MMRVICFIFQRHGAELNKLLNEMESQKELLHTYELTLEHKDSIVSNITNAIQKQKERNEMLRAFTLWKLRHCDERREAKAQDVCVKLTEDYENRLQTATRELEVARNEIARLHAERDQYEETMKKAFMRGVCALNLEAMSMFREGEEGGRGPPPPAANPNSGGEIPSGA
ncbi:Centrosomal protein POC5 [Acropora cervicornis]|uniref:Centrosomal protein POC5 n=1 Tax=Acropora cervicornis TaxID=6130 RepID=A0AAD9QQM6_ACRCE|nr:Centrosomal protein POC5 [Acropora cervicornis]